MSKKVCNVNVLHDPASARGIDTIPSIQGIPLGDLVPKTSTHQGLQAFMLPTQTVSKKQKPAKSFLLWWEGGCVSSSSQKTTKQAQKHRCVLSRQFKRTVSSSRGLKVEILSTRNWERNQILLKLCIYMYNCHPSSLISVGFECPSMSISQATSAYCPYSLWLFFALNAGGGIT